MRRFEDLLRPGPHPVILGEVHPTHSAVGGQQKLGWAGHVLASDTLSCMKQVVASDHLSLWIGKKSKCIPDLRKQIAIDFWTVDADGNGANPHLMEVAQIALDAP